MQLQSVPARDGQAILIHDCLLGRAQDAEIVFQLAIGLDAEQLGNVVTATRNGTPLLRLVLPDDNLNIQSGGDVPGQGGWVSPRFGLRLPAPRIAWKGRVDATGVNTVLTVPAH